MTLGMAIAILFIIASCQKPEITSIEAPSTAQVGEEIRIKITSKYTSHGSVDFGDGNIEDETNYMGAVYSTPHKYTKEGTYTITVTEKKSKNNKYPTSKSVTIVITP